MKVYISGYGTVSSLGNSPQEIFTSLVNNESGSRYMTEWDRYKQFNCRVGSPARYYDPKILPRIARRSMSKAGEMASIAILQALEMANLKVEDFSEEKSLFIVGATKGNGEAAEEFFDHMRASDHLYTYCNSFLKYMNHSVAANSALVASFNGSVISASAACATSAQSIILGWELLQTGLYDIAICGGADELDPSTNMVFDNAYAASTKYNDSPTNTPRPFDRDRDGVIVSEGGGIVILETEERIKKRNGKALAEIVSGAYFREGSHLTQNSSESIIHTMKMSLRRASLKAEEIEYINAHATGTVHGDQQEVEAIKALFQSKTPVSSLKGYFGHSISACGALEIIATIEMMKNGILIGTRNLENISDDCKGIDHIQKNRAQKVDLAMSNNFAFGGINTSVIVRNLL